MPPRLVYIPRDMDYSSKTSADKFNRVSEAKSSSINTSSSADNDYRPVSSNDANTPNKNKFKVPPIPCIFFPWFKDHAKLMIYFHGIGEDLHVIRKEI